MEAITDFLKQPFPWYVAGPLIGLFVPLFLIIGNKSFGISSTLRHFCSACIPIKKSYFSYNWKEEIWSFFFVAGIFVGGYLAGFIQPEEFSINLSPEALLTFKKLGVNNLEGLLPKELFNWNNLLSIKGFLFFICGGFLIGFGTRYANGCTSGHSIMGLSLLNPASLIATIGFFIGGLISTHLFISYLLSL